ncbi:hypothetical protein KBD20_01295 [Candidatus Saccharibacteria bacterium]|nr:hypothetical protein [Candidatus Saccharibacteria bacterium]
MNTTEILPSQAERAQNAEFTVAVHSVEDEQGYTRNLYELSPQLSVTFRGRDELPTFSEDITIHDSQRILTTDEAPKEVDQQDFDEYIRNYSEVSSSGEHLIVNATPVGIIDLSLRLCENQGEFVDSLAAMRQNFIDGKIGQAETIYLDMLSTAVFVGKEATAESDTSDTASVTDGLLDVALALAGSEEKTAIIHEKMRVIEAQSKQLVIREIGEKGLELGLGHKPIDPEIIREAQGLVLVRATDTPPLIDQEGLVHMQSAGDVTKGMVGNGTGTRYVPRYTVHFSLNHTAESHGMLTGTENVFKGRAYTIVAPLDQALCANGRPAAVRGVDTYFAVGPSEDVILPGSIILKDGGAQDSILITEGNMRTYKTEGFDQSDVEGVQELYAGVHDTLMASLDAPQAYSEIQNQLGFLAGSDIRHHLLSLYEQDPGQFEGVMGQVVSSLLVMSAVIEQGGTPVSANEHSISTPGVEKVVTELASRLTASHSAHIDNIEARLEDVAMRRLALGEGRRDTSDKELDVNAPFDWQKPVPEDDLNSLLASPDCPQSLRRSYISSGFLKVRSGDEAKIEAKYRASNPRRPGS